MNAIQAREKLRRAIGGCRLLGVLFVFLGLLPLIGIVRERVSWTTQLLATVDSIVLVGPGVWYVVASFHLRRQRPWAARTSLFVVAAQAAAVAIVFVLGLMLWQIMLLIPVILAAFFLPALGAFAWDMRQAARALTQLSPEGRAFRPIMRRDDLPL